MVTVLALIVVCVGAAAAFLVIADSGLRGFEALVAIKREIACCKVQVMDFPSPRTLTGSPRALAAAFTPAAPAIRRAA